MSKIAKAVERAKRSREARIGMAQEPRPPLSSTGPALPSQQPPVYSQTRVVLPEPHYLEAHRVLTLLDDSHAIDTYNLLCTRVLAKTGANFSNTIMITSCGQGEGKSLTSINLAVSIARRVQHTVLLVDADLRSPKIHHYLGLPVAKGLAEHLTESVPLAELLVSPGVPKMVVLPAGKRVDNPAEILVSPKMEQLIYELKSRYPDRYVIFDCPPLLTVPDSLGMASYVDGLLLVVEAGRASREDVRKAIELCNGKPLLGLVMNKSRHGGKKYYYS